MIKVRPDLRIDPTLMRKARCKLIGHFRVAVNLTMRARLSAKLFIRKLVLFAYE